MRLAYWRAVLRCLAIAMIAAGGVGAPASAAASSRWDALADVTFRDYSVDDGLPSGVATAIADDAQGFLWVGTQGGLGRWDGYRFRTYRTSPGDPGALADGWITALLSDPRGILWIGTSAGGLARYDRRNDRFVPYRAGPHGLSSVHVTALAQAGAGRLWVATDRGLDLLDPRTGAITVFRARPGVAGALPDASLLSLLADRHGGLWIGTSAGLVRRDPAGRFAAVALDDGGTPIDPAIVSLYADAGRHLWIGTQKHGAFVLSPGGGAPRRVVETSGGYHLSHESVAAITGGNPGDVWLGTSTHGVVVVDRASGRTRRVNHLPAVPRSLADDAIWSLYRDRSGGVWVGTTGNLSRLETRQGVQVVSGIGRDHSLTQPDVGAILAAADGRVWAGLGSKGIDIIDPASGRVSNVRSRAGLPTTALPETFIVALTQWSPAKVYIGTGVGLYSADANGANVRRVTLPGRKPDAISYTTARIGDRLWVGGEEDGLWSFAPDRKSPNVVHFGADRLTDARIVSLVPGAANDLWVGTKNGLNRLDLRSGAVERILPQPDRPDGLTATYIPALLIDRTGRLWVATQGGGIQVMTGWRGGHRVFRHLTMAQGLPNDDVASLLLDRTGRVWAETEGGIAVIDPTTFVIDPLGRADGVPSSIPWDHSAAALPGGDLLFGAAGASGITVIRPDLFRPWRYPPPVVVTDVRVGGKSVPEGRFAGRGDDVTLVVPPGANSIAVEFAALDYAAPDKNRYAYRLDGFDKAWVQTDATRRVASYNNLAPGRYRLRLRGSNRNGVWTDRTLNLSVEVLPAWHQTWWFRTALAILGIASVGLMLWLWTLAARRRQKALAAMIETRTAELRATQRELEQLAYHDTLTGLPNRRGFSDVVTQLTAPGDQPRPFALILIDLDRFKLVNDTLGHDAGDALLVAAAARFTASVRDSDNVARLGGDEFAILVSDDGDASSATALCDRLIRAFETPVWFGQHQILTSPSLGIALYPRNGTTQADLYKAADLALYDAKRAGRNTWRVSNKAALDGVPAPAEASQCLPA